MSIRKIIELNKIYKLYLIRRLLNFGILKSKTIKISILIIFIALLSIVSTSGYLFISQVSTNEKSLLLMIKTFTASTVMWTILVVLVLKVIFSKSQDFFRIMENFPLTNKSKNLSLFIFESICSLVAMFFISFSFTISIILNSSIEYLGYLVVDILYVSIVTYLLLQLISKITSIACSILKIEKIYSLVNITILVIIFVIIYKRTESLTSSLVNDYINNENKTRSILLLFNESYQNFGFMLTTFIFLLIVFFSAFIILLLPDNSYSIQSKFINTFKNIKNPNVFKSYILAIIRDKNMISNIIGAYVFAILLLSINLDKYILYATLLVVFNSIYCFVQTLRVRLICYSLKYSSVKDYLLLVLSQLLVTYTSSLPLLVLFLCLNGPSLDVLIPYCVITIGTFILVMGGVLFPPYNDNPFSIITSLVVISIPLLFILVFIALLNLNLVLNIIVFVTMFIFVIYFSILALNYTEKRYRNEKFTIFS
ncbi:hypothetical protein [Staphylococcus intermedius]|uniref:Uncharacterized protein n=2 Tax=Staphylococcus intermedius TaxID=1285 RepID=A0A380G021_STAIN|nr:hypothetical protein [Staphylococcus intermedius]SUM43720.1 Uncharacterised protein [Staphylococcus intermedius NCTC 11048]